MITKWKYSAASAYQKVQLHSPQSEKFVFFFAMYSSAPQPRFRGVHSLREAPTRSRSTKRFRAPESGDTGYKESKSSPEQHYLQSNIISKHLQTYQIHPNAPKSNQSLKIYAPTPPNMTSHSRQAADRQQGFPAHCGTNQVSTPAAARGAMFARCN
jgi:hypothetical protein